MSKYWIVSGKPMPTKERMLEHVKTKCGGVCTQSRFDIPALRVGTLDTLMALSDDLVKADYFVETTTRKIGNLLHTIMNEDMEGKGKAAAPSTVLSVEGANADLYLSHFKWCEAKYPIRMSCRELTEMLQGQVGLIEEDFRKRLITYNTIQNTLSAAERKRGGTLLVRDINDLVKKEHVKESEYLTTLFVIVNTHSLNDWKTKYESLVDYVVPRSTQIIAQENDCTLVTVVLFRRAVDDFKLKARENRFTVREFKYDPTADTGANTHKKLLDEREQIKNKLLLWCKANFGEAFIAWTHLKAIRTHVESILRYGLPVNYQAVMLQPKKGSDKKLRAALGELFATLSTLKNDKGKKDQEEAASIAAGLTEPYYPYVYFDMDIDMSPK